MVVQLSCRRRGEQSVASGLAVSSVSLRSCCRVASKSSRLRPLGAVPLPYAAAPSTQRSRSHCGVVEGASYAAISTNRAQLRTHSSYPPKKPPRHCAPVCAVAPPRAQAQSAAAPRSTKLSAKNVVTP